MKYSRAQFKPEYYQLWQLGLIIPCPENASEYSIKYRKNETDQYSRITLKAINVNDALERACYAITYASPWRPEDIDLHAVYDQEDNLLWVDEPFYDLIQKKFEFRGMERREFLKRFGATSAAILFGFFPQNVQSQYLPFSFLKKASSAAPSGEQLYTTAGPFTWTALASVTSVNVVAIGGLTDSFFINNTTVLGGAGAGSPGTYVGTGGGNGGNTGTYSANQSGGYWAGPGGGGAGGYSGAGGNGGNGAGNGVTAGHSRGGGGGGTGLYGIGANGAGYNSGTGGAGGGGYGGIGTTQGNVGSGGSGGANGNGMHGAAYGGGAGWLTTSGAGCGGGLGWKNSIAVSPGTPYSGSVGTGASVTNSGTHGVGAVRIMWGSGRSFPSNAT
jgi:hypothetical protein